MRQTRVMWGCRKGESDRGVTNLLETVSYFCRVFIFPRMKFLNDGWKDYLPDERDSLNALCMGRMKIPERADEKDI